MKTSFLLLCILILFQGCFRSPQTVQDDGTDGRCPNCLFLLDGAAQQAFDDTPVPDPSGIPQTNDFGQIVQERARFVADFDGDGLEDIALAAEPECFSRGSGSFFCYLQTTNGLFKEIGELSAYTWENGVVVEHLKEVGGPDGRLWTATSCGISCTFITIFDIKEKCVSSKQHLWLYSDGYGDNVSSDVAYTVIGHSSHTPVRLEWGIYTNGTVIWPTLPGLVPKKNAADDTP